MLNPTYLSHFVYMCVGEGVPGEKENKNSNMKPPNSWDYCTNLLFTLYVQKTKKSFPARIQFTILSI